MEYRSSARMNYQLQSPEMADFDACPSACSCGQIKANRCSRTEAGKRAWLTTSTGSPY